MELVFYISVGLLAYVMVGYGILAYLLVKIKRIFTPTPKPHDEINPKVSLIIAAYNEQDIIEQKFMNNLDLKYNPEKIEFLFICDGSDDNTMKILRRLRKQNPYLNITLMFKKERAGKTAALNRAIPKAKGDILIFTDSNTFLNDIAIKKIVDCYRDPKVGAVAGEKRVKDGAEGAYWKYESVLKKLDSELYSCVGAAGELFSIRKELYVQQPTNTLLDDFMITMQVVEQGYKIKYEPNAYAIEEGSENMKEEFKRKVRIGAGGLQSVLRLPKFALPISIFNIQYLSRKGLRWTLTPIAIVLALISNIILAFESNYWQFLLASQIGLLYIPTILYMITAKTSKLFYPQFYFMFMHYTLVLGWIRLVKGTQKAAWEKAKRKVS